MSVASLPVIALSGVLSSLPVLTAHAQASDSASNASPAASEAGRTTTMELKPLFATATDWRVEVHDHAHDYDSGNDLHPSSSRVCLIGGMPQISKCWLFNALFGTDLDYQQMDNLGAVTLQTATGVKGLVLNVTASYPSGNDAEKAIWVYDPAHDQFVLASALAVGGNGEERMFTAGSLDGYLMTSVWRRQAEETRWEPHVRDITVYRYTHKADAPAYAKVLEYDTNKEYDAEDDQTLDAEMPVILRRLRLLSGSK